jgi:hypothetical protein
VFYSDLFGVLDKNYQKDDEELVIGRLALSENSSIFNHSGLVGTYGKWGDSNNDQEKIYFNKTKLNENLYIPYQSQIGGQAMIYAALGLYLPCENVTKIAIFKFLTASFSALVFLFFLIWTKRHFGFQTSISTFILIILSIWIILFSNKLWWNLWGFYLPFVFMLFYLDKKQTNVINSKKLFLYSFLLVFIKCFINGYEYISTTLIMFTMPVLFYYILYHWKIKKTLQLFLKMVLGAISGFLVSLSILIFQISQLVKTEGNMNGFDYIYDTLLRRTYDTPSKYHNIEDINSMKSTIWEVIQLYLNGAAYKFKTYNGTKYEISFLMFIVFFLCITIFYIYFKNKNPMFIETKNNFNALIITFWVSIIAPFSWFILFKSHSYIHTHMNFIVWYMPFALLGYILIGYLFSEIILRFTKYALHR